ncbi:MAG: hypothetical protein CEE41_05120 [Hadesarchaea archaeon B3_Hades]|nr:MAG: hypothetical protein CEE41_05120 [Hadesarchaea archaeon B3_Hades]
MSDNNKEKELIVAGLKFSVWGYILVIFSSFFFCVGYWLDEKLNTAPIFMFGLFLLAVFLCIGRLLQKALRKCR